MELRDRARLAAVVGAAIVPDLDLLLRIADGRNHHQAEVHSVGFAVLAAAAAFLLARAAGSSRPVGLSLAVGAAWVSHLVLDYLNRDTNPPIGLMAFWPVSQAYVKFPYPVFLDIGRTLDWAMVRNNTLAVAWETVVLAPLALAAWRARSKG